MTKGKRVSNDVQFLFLDQSPADVSNGIISASIKQSFLSGSLHRARPSDGMLICLWSRLHNSCNILYVALHVHRLLISIEQTVPIRYYTVRK